MEGMDNRMLVVSNDQVRCINVGLHDETAAKA